MPKITIDGREFIAREGATVLETALANDVYIPNLCYLENGDAGLTDDWQRVWLLL